MLLTILTPVKYSLKFVRIPDDPMRYRDEKFCWTYQRGVSWPDHYIGPDPMTCWIIETSQGFTDVGLYRISENVRAYAYSVNHRVDIREDIKHYQDTLSYTLSKVDYRMGENIYMLPSDMNLNIKSGTAGYNNKILVSNGTFSLGKNDEVITAVPTPKISHKNSKVVVQSTTTAHKDLAGKPNITHKEEKVALILSLAGSFAIWYVSVGFHIQTDNIPHIPNRD